MAPVLGTGEETMGQSSLQERLDETFRETVRVRDDVLAGRMTVKECNRRVSELEKELKALEREFKDT